MPRVVRAAARGLLPLTLLAAAGLVPEAPRAAGPIEPTAEPMAHPAGWITAASTLDAETIGALPRGVRRLAADAVWLHAVQYYGERRRAGARDYPRLAPLTGIALRFDPEHRSAAVEGALLLAEPPPLGAGAPARAEELLERWTAARPEDWSAALLLGLVREWHRGDPAAAAATFREAAARPGAPDYFLALAARSGAAAGDREGARVLWSLLLREAETHRERANARTHLLQIEALDRRDAWAAAAAEFRERTGRFPETWADLRDSPAGGPPLDPAGAPYRLLPGGVVRLSPQSPLAGHPERGRAALPPEAR